MSLSVAETAHKASITTFINSLPKTDVDALSPVTFYSGVDPPPVCNDGIRRPNALDYIDYLFQSPTIDQVIKTHLGTTPYSITLRAENTPRQFSATVTNTGVISPLLIRSTATSGSTLPVALTLATQVTLTSGTTFTNASSSTGQKWDSGFSSALPLSSGYITATPGAFISSANTRIQVGLSTSALVVPGTVGNLTSFTVSYGFYVVRNAAANSTTPGSISLYKLVPGVLADNLIQIGLSSYATAPVLTVSYDGQSIRYLINGIAATNTSNGGSTAVAVSLNTLHATGLFSFSGDSLTSVMWGSSMPGPQGSNGANGNAGIQGPAGPAGPAGPGFSAITPINSNRVLTSNGTSTTATAQTNIVYLTSANATLPASTLTAPNLAASTGGVIAPIASTIPGTLRTGFSSFAKIYTTAEFTVNVPKVVLSGLQTSGLYVCSVAGTGGSDYTKLSQIYIIKSGTSFVATKFGTDIPASSLLTWNMPLITDQSGSISPSFSLSFTSTVSTYLSVSITLLASTPNFY